jgi:hypothetical protein
MTPYALADTLSRRYALLLIEHDLLYAAAMQAKTKKERDRLLQAADAVLCREFDDVLNPPQGGSHDDH